MQKIEICVAGRFKVWSLNFLLALLKIFSKLVKKISLEPCYTLFPVEYVTIQSGVLQYVHQVMSAVKLEWMLLLWCKYVCQQIISLPILAENHAQLKEK